MAVLVLTMTYHLCVCYVKFGKHTGHLWGNRASDGIVVNCEPNQRKGVLKT